MYLIYRAINNELIDTYQLKSLDGIFGRVHTYICTNSIAICFFQEEELGLEDQAIIKKENKLYLVLSKILDEAKRKDSGKLRMLLIYMHTYIYDQAWEDQLCECKLC